MEKMDSLQIREVKQTLSNFIENQDMPMEVMRMILVELLHDVEQKTNEELMKLINERKESEADGN